MNKSILILFAVTSFQCFSQKKIDEPLDKKIMQEELELFRTIRKEANSGVNKYRSEEEIDSIYQWAEYEISKSNTFLDFYNILWEITDFEGSLHNSLFLPPKTNKALRQETDGYFPFPIKIIQGKALMNLDSGSIPLGSEIISIDDEDIDKILPKLHKYYTTDGFNKTGKEIGINANFSLYYRLAYGKNDSFVVRFKLPKSNENKSIEIKSVGRKTYTQNFKMRHSKSFDGLSYEVDNDPPYEFDILNKSIGHLSISSFSIGWNDKHPKHLKYLSFLDSVFQVIKTEDIQNLIVDVRHNGGGSDPNDLVTYSYLTDRNFTENVDAWVTFWDPPYWKYVKEVSIFTKHLEKKAYVKALKSDFPVVKGNRFYQDSTSSDRKVRTPRLNAFTGNIYLLVSPRTASAGSLFAAMVAGNSNTTVIGKETQGGYYGHNGHIPIRYRLPKSKIKFMFSLVNLQQDVPVKSNQKPGMGIVPDFDVEQSFEDFLSNEDTALKYTIDLINRRSD